MREYQRLGQEVPQDGPQRAPEFSFLFKSADLESGSGVLSHRLRSPPPPGFGR